MKEKPKTYWCVYSDEGEPLGFTLSDKREYAISDIANHSCYSWDCLKAIGYTCRKVRITEVPGRKTK